MTSGFSPGSLVRARGRDWIVLPDRESSVIRLRPLTTSLADEIGLFLPLEGPHVSSAEFSPPGPDHPGVATGVMTLFNAARLNLRSGAAPFRSLGRISVTPRPYQFVPLIMALRLDPVRLLIADDVGVGKTIEAGMWNCSIISQWRIWRGPGVSRSRISNKPDFLRLNTQGSTISRGTMLSGSIH
jgi:hypothetical protein